MIGLIRSTASELLATLTGPGALIRILRERDIERFNPHAGHPSAFAESVIRWDELGRGKDGLVTGWGARNGRYDYVARQVPALKSFGFKTEIESWTCDLQDVIGLAASKARLGEYDSLDSMIEANRPDWLRDPSESRLHELLSHPGVKIGRPGGRDHLSLNLCDGRVMLINEDGSHHFAAARHVAARLQRNTPLVAPLHVFGIDEAASDAVRGEFEMIVLPGDAVLGNLFHNAMESYGATYFTLDLPSPYDRGNGRVVLFPRDQPKSAKAAQACKDGGLFDLGEHLDVLMVVQRGHVERVEGPQVPPFFEDDPDEAEAEAEAEAPRPM